MKKNHYFLNTALAVVLGIGLLVCVLLRTFAPAVILPELNIPAMVLISLLALLLDHYIKGRQKRCYILVALLAAVTFGLLPYAAGFVTMWHALKLAAVGGVTFAVTAWLYRSVQERLSSGPVARLAPLLSAFGLFLAAQCFAGMII